MSLRRKLGIGFGVVASCATSLAVAQEAMLEEIVVTAQKREQNLQDVPIAVTALTDSFITEHNIASVQDMAGAVPGLVLTNNMGNGTAPVSIRGIGGPSGGGSIFNDEPVGVYIDGVYIARQGASVQDLVDVQSIEVLRGPQGTLYGRNSTAGALLITTKRPTREFESTVTASYDSLNTLKLTGTVSNSLSETVSGRLAVGYGNGGNYVKNIVNGQDVGGANNKTVRGSIRIEPRNDLTIDLIGTYADQLAKPALYAVSALHGASPAYAGNPFVVRPGFQQAIENDRVALDDVTQTKLKSSDGTVLVNWNTDTFALASITGYRKQSTDGTTDSDAQPNAADYADATGALTSSSVIAATRATATDWTGLLRNGGRQDNKEWTQELRLRSTGNNKLDWTAGLYYLHEDNLFDFNIDNWQSRVPVLNNPPAAPWGTRQHFYATQKVDAYAAFADMTYNLSEAWSLTAGARYSSEKKTVGITQTPTALFSGTTQPTLPVSVFPPTEKQFSNFSPRAVVNYKPAAGMLLYASFGKGFKSGGYNSFDTNPATNNYPEERINAYEVGMKSEFANRRIRTNVSVFNYDYTNVQLRQAVFTGGVAIRSVPKAQVKGVELETTVVVNQAFNLHANVGYLDARLKEGTLNALRTDLNSLPALTYGAALAGPPGAPINGVVVPQDVSGNQMARAPRWQGSLNGEYTTGIGNSMSARLGLTWRYQSKVYFSETNQDTDVFVGKAWSEVDVRAALLSTDNRWEAALLGQNVLDNRHVTQVAPFSGFPVATVNLPARVGLQLTYRMK